MVSKMGAKSIKKKWMFANNLAFFTLLYILKSPKMIPMYHLEMKFGLPLVLHRCEINIVSKMAIKTINSIFARISAF